MKQKLSSIAVEETIGDGRGNKNNNGKDNNRDNGSIISEDNCNINSTNNIDINDTDINDTHYNESDDNEYENVIKTKVKRSNRLKKESKRYTDKLNKRGVIYLSKVPPFMKPNKVRSLFDEYGEVTRLFLSQEDESQRKRRKSSGGNGSKQFTEGWLEYDSKATAKRVAESLNNTAIGATKGDFYHDDLWNIKYLKNFKWDYLTEKFAYERRVREQKLNASMLQAKRSNAEFAELVEKQKTETFVRDRKIKATMGTSQDVNDNGNGISARSADSSKHDNGKIRRKFRQFSAIATNHGEKDAKVDKQLLNTIFK